MKNNFLFRFNSIYSLENINTIQKLCQLYKISLISIKNKGYSITQNKNFIPLVWNNAEDCFILCNLSSSSNLIVKEINIDYVNNLICFINSYDVKEELINSNMNNEFRFLLFEFTENFGKYIFHGIWNITENKFRKGYINNFCKENYHFFEDNSDYIFLRDSIFIRSRIKTNFSYLELYEAMIKFTKENFIKNNLYNLNSGLYNINRDIDSRKEYNKYINYNNKSYYSNSSYLYNNLEVKDKLDINITDYFLKMKIIDNFNSFILNYFSIEEDYSLVFNHEFNYLKKLCISRLDNSIKKLNILEEKNQIKDIIPILGF